MWCTSECFDMPECLSGCALVCEGVCGLVCACGVSGNEACVYHQKL